jgi:catechol 2,3-dioxygenase-like lactoylglutathione lyase family enzyme
VGHISDWIAYANSLEAEVERLSDRAEEADRLANIDHLEATVREQAEEIRIATDLLGRSLGTDDAPSVYYLIEVALSGDDEAFVEVARHYSEQAEEIERLVALPEQAAILREQAEALQTIVEAISERLHDALLKYGEHQGQCGALLPHAKAEDCTCGLHKAVTEGRPDAD